MRCAIWYHLYNLKNVKNTHRGVLLFVKLQASARHYIYFMQMMSVIMPLKFFEANLAAFIIAGRGDLNWINSLQLNVVTYGQYYSIKRKKNKPNKCPLFTLKFFCELKIIFKKVYGLYYG